MTNETDKHEQALPARDELKGLVVEQTRVLERLAKTFAPEEEEERQKRFIRLLVRSASVGALAVSGIIGSWELGVYLKDSWDVRRMANDYAQVGVRLYYQENNVSVAKDFIAKALELQPSNSEYLFLDAYIDGMSAVRDLFNLDRPYDAQELNSAYEALAKSVFLEQQQPDAPEPYILRGQIYAALKDNDRALETLQQAIAIDPTNDFALMRLGVISYNANEIDKATEFLDQALALNPDSKWAYLWKGVMASDGRDFEKAKTNFDKALRIDPRFDMAHYNLGWAYLGSKPKNYVEAEGSFRKALSLNPDFKEAFYGLGMVFGYQSQYSIAKQYLTKALDLDDRFLTAWKWRGIVNDELGLYDDALMDFSSAIAISPTNADIYMRRARVGLKTEAFDSSLEDLLLAKKYDPKNARIFLYLGQLYAKLDQLEAATEATLQALDLRAGYSDAYSLLSEVYVKQQKYADAIAALDNALENTRYRRERFYVKRAAVHMTTGKPKLALNDYISAREDNPENAVAWLGEFEAALALDNRQVAGVALDEFVKLRPNDERIKTMRDKLE